MTYFNQLIAFNNTQFNLLDLDIASELLAMSNKSLIEINKEKNAQEEFNEACSLIKETYLNVDCEISLSTVVNAFIEAMSDNDNNINKINLETILENLYQEQEQWQQTN